ncbi:MAG TPA: hypothetical protein VF717_03855 [Pyrinomonadaceae bacterium]|jgi:hypothetical protein
MKAQTRKFTLILLSAALVLIGGVAISFKAARSHAGHAQKDVKPVTSKETLPVIISKVKKLGIVGATVLGEGTENAQVAIEIKNNSDLAVYFVALTNGTLKTSEYGISRDGLDVDGDPQVVIVPHGTITMNVLLSNLDGRFPIVLSAGGFSDGFEDGDESVLESMRYRREREKARRMAEKGAKP